ncbi:hypothetical protein BT93_E1199 [Corymbia citriodora subsp. variegata]|nr:hypothetical protein BT93_E1199 [Corymbia citriodora subsp. variegata]
MSVKGVEGRAMVIYKLLLKAAVLGALLGLYHKHLAQADDSIAKPRCQSSCGNLSIPYPFGLSHSDPHCRINSSSFRVDCDYSANPPVAYFWNKSSNIEILNISVEDHELRINTSIGRDCYNSSGHDDSSSIDPGLLVAEFPFSSTKNKFTAIGCDTLATFQDQDGKFSFGCMSSCSNVSDVSNESCTGIGCCETSIPRNSFNYRLSIMSFSNHSDVLGFNPCSYAFVAEIGSYNFSVGDLKQLKFNSSPVVLDWAVGNQTCEEAKKNSTSYMCTKNTNCTNTDTKNGYGYKCTCSKGYRGNPYLGCHDIDECADPEMNRCEKICHNVIGSYTCSCPNGYHGDGKKGGGIGQGCTIKPSHLMEILVGVATGIGGIVLLLLCWWLPKYTKRRREAKLKQKFFQRNGGIVLQQRLFFIENNHMEKGKLFALTELDTATDHFNKNRILGQGGQGTVFKGMLPDGTIVAVKKSKVIDIGQVEQFVNEIVILSQINHRNVVKLFGFCLESEVPLLIYEFVPNGTLYQYLHDPDKEFPVSWEMRLRIASEVAGALSYMHSAAAVPVYHRDIKSSNILLDEKYRAKVSDFGASKSITIDQTHLTTMVRGTFGYLDPEYYQTSQFTDKSNVYSFGVVLVELLTGEKPISQLRAEEDRNLASYFIISMEENRLFDVLDKEVLDHGKNEEIIVVSNLAKRCLGLHRRYRPTMKEVAMELERLQSLRNPTVVRQNEEEIDCIRNESCVSSTIPMLKQSEAGIELTSMEEDQSLLSPR